MKAIKYRTNSGARTALLIKTGRKFHHLIQMDFPIRVSKVPKSEERYFEELEYRMVGRPYPIPRAKRIFRDAARQCYGSLRNAPKNVREALR